jgi:hypothetical protein
MRCPTISEKVNSAQEMIPFVKLHERAHASVNTWPTPSQINHYEYRVLFILKLSLSSLLEGSVEGVWSQKTSFLHDILLSFWTLGY